MDNERPIEKLLRRYAKKRRDDPAAKGLELHPATRRMLQGEVARQFPKPAAGGTQAESFLKRLWPRLVWALPVFVVLGAGVWAIVQSKKPQDGIGNLAKMETSSPARLSESLGRTETPAQAVGGVTPNETALTTPAETDSSRAKDNASNLGLEEGKLKTDRAPALAVNAPAPSVAASATLAPDANPGKTFQEKALADRDALEGFTRDARTDKSRDLTLTARRAPAEAATSLGEKAETVRARSATPPDKLALAPSPGSAVARNRAGAPLSATPPPAAAPPLSFSAKSPPTKTEYDRAQIPTPTVVQRFVQTTVTSTSDSLAERRAGTPSVLDTFQVEQTGNQLRVIDSDGSSYNGSIQSATAEALYDSADEAKKAVALSKRYGLAGGERSLGSKAGQNYFFSVAGTNRTLKQPVAFTGNLLVLTNALPTAKNGVALAPTTKSQLPQGQSGSPTLLNSSISGKVQLGAEKEMQIRAVPVAR